MSEMELKGQKKRNFASLSNYRGKRGVETYPRSLFLSPFLSPLYKLRFYFFFSSLKDSAKS